MVWIAHARSRPAKTPLSQRPPPDRPAAGHPPHAARGRDEVVLPPLLLRGLLRRRALRRWHRAVRQSALMHSRRIGPLRRRGLLRLSLLRRAVRRERLSGLPSLPRLTGAIGRAALLRRVRPRLQIVLALAGLGRRVTRRIPQVARRVRVDAVRIGPAQRALLAHHLASDSLRRMDLANDALIARRLLWRNRKRRGGDAAAGAAANGEAG